MPDPERKTVSATEVPALFNASPYITRWMLYQKFANDLSIERKPDNRMLWGSLIQPLILQQVAEQKKLQVFPNETDTYARRGLVGCTRDGIIVSPDHGPGSLEIKCCWDYQVWATKWGSGQTVPRDIDMQLQTQMYVGTEGIPHQWGIVAVFLCAEIIYFERRPVVALWNRIEHEAEKFFREVESKQEPDPFGAACEAPWLTSLYPVRPDSVLDLSEDPDHVKTSADVSMYKDFKESAAGSDRVAEEKRLQLLALAKGAQYVKLPCGVGYRVQKSGKGYTVIPYIPDVLLPPPPPKTEPILAAG